MSAKQLSSVKVQDTSYPEVVESSVEIIREQLQKESLNQGQGQVTDTKGSLASIPGSSGQIIQAGGRDSTVEPEQNKTVEEVMSVGSRSVVSGNIPPPFHPPIGISQAMFFGESNTTEPATPTSIFSEHSNSESGGGAGDFLSPTGLASSGKRFWNESSSWLISRIGSTNNNHSYSQSSSTSAYSSCDRPNYRDPTAVERNNLLNITKLVIRELIEWSMRHGRSLESDHPPLQHFFIVLEHAMRHGLKPKKGLLGPKKELWDILQLVEKRTNEAFDITSSIRDLPTVSTHLGRARAFMRLALMQKKLADYFKVLVDIRDDVLVDFYEPFALMMCDEAPVLSGLLVGLNVIDCNFCLKEEDLDIQQGVIDFSLYLRSTRSSESAEDEVEQSNMDNVLDQKNYIEELNRHLNATVTNLQTRSETLTTTNALLSEDLAISKNTIVSLQEENRQLRLRLNQYLSASSPEALNTKGLDTSLNESRNSPHSSDTEAEAAAKVMKKDERNMNLDVAVGSLLGTSPTSGNLSVPDLSKKLHEERTAKSSLEKELDRSNLIKDEMETAMKSMEKDMHEKQDTIISLRTQLEDIKQINLEMYRKLQECEKTITFRTDLNTKLEEKVAMLDDTINKLEEKLSAAAVDMREAQKTMRSLGQQIADRELRVSTLEGDLRIEREWRQSLQDISVKDKEKISELLMESQKWRLRGTELHEAHKQIDSLRQQCKDHELTLEEMGVKVAESKLLADEFREATSSASSTWKNDKDFRHCKLCEKEFSLTRRKHHCRNCGNIFCKTCSDNAMELPSSAKPVRVCDTCYTFCLQRYSANANQPASVDANPPNSHSDMSNST